MKSLLSQIPQGRVVLYALGLAILPVIVSYLYVDSLLSEASTNQMELAGIQEKVAQKVLYQQSNRQVRERYKNTDALYIHKKIESLPLMQEEISYLQNRLLKSTLPEDIVLERRLQNLLRSENGCVFLETAAEVGPNYKQVIECQSKPAEMDNADLCKILTYLESDDEGNKDKPHLIISEAQFDRKKNNVGDSWNVLLKVIRREYTL
jgi:hypothetical protein